MPESTHLGYTGHEVPSWKEAVEIAKGFNEVYKIMLQASKERDPQKVQRFLDANMEDLPELLRDGSGHTTTITDINGRPHKIPEWATNPFEKGDMGVPNPFKNWFHSQFPMNHPYRSRVMDSRRAYHAALKNLEEVDDYSEARETQRALKGVVDVMKSLTKDISSALNDTYPVKFNYKGFKISNPQHFSRYVVNQMLEGIEALVALFKRRSMLPSLKEGISEVILRYASGLDKPGVAGTYNQQTGALTLLKHIVDNRDHGHYDDWVMEVFIHEFAHNVYYKQLSGEAKAFWDGGWDAIYDAMQQDRGKGIHQLVVSRDDRNTYFDILKAHDYQPLTALEQLQRSYDKRPDQKRMDDALKFKEWLKDPSTEKSPAEVAWLTEYMDGTPLLTHYGKEASLFFSNPQRWLKKFHPSVADSPENVQQTHMDWYRGEYIKNLGLFSFHGHPVVTVEQVIEFGQLGSKEDEVREEMGFPTPYAETNPSEDFAETFLTFLLKPERLSKVARYRIERTLSLSNLYGKPIMQLAEVAKKLTLEGHADLALKLLDKEPHC